MESKPEKGVLGTLFSYAYRLNDNANSFKMWSNHFIELASITMNVAVPIVVTNLLEGANNLAEEALDEDFNWSTYTPLIIGSSAFLLTTLLPRISNCIVSSVRYDMQKEIVLDMTKGVYERELDDLISKPSGEYFAALTKNYDSVDSVLPTIVSNLLPAILETAGISAVLSYRYGEVGLAPAITLLIDLGLAFISEQSSKKVKLKNAQAMGMAYVAMMESEKNYKVAHQYGNVEHEIKRLENALSQLEETYNELRDSKERSELLLTLVSRLGLLGSFAYAVFNPPSPNFWTEDFVLFAYYLLRFDSINQTLLSKFNELYKGFIDAKNTVNFLNKKPRFPDPSFSVPLNLNAPPRIEFRNVTFGYSEEKNILSDVSFSIEPGQKVAIMGETGSGKSTLLKLLQRFYTEFEGNILINGVDIRCALVKELRSVLSVVSQETGLVKGTLYENIQYGDFTADDDDIFSAARFAGLYLDEHRFFSESHRRGANFSGGEKQRISIARSLLKANAYIFLLDEPTSSLDQDTARDVAAVLDRLTTEATTIMVTHDPNLAINADLIVYMDKGKIIESGTFEELMEKQEGAFYQQMLVQCDKLGISINEIEPSYAAVNEIDTEEFLAWREERRQKPIHTTNDYAFFLDIEEDRNPLFKDNNEKNREMENLI